MSTLSAISRLSGYFPCWIAKRVVQEVVALPLSTLSTVGLAVTLALDCKPVTLAFITAQAVLNSAMFFQQSRSLKGNKWVDTALKVVLFVLIIQQVAGAYEAVGRCPEPLGEKVSNFLNCFRDEKTLDQCSRLLDPSCTYKIAVATHHASDCTSVVKFNTSSPAVCFFSSLNSTSDRLTRTCFDDPTMVSRSIREVITNVSLLRYNDLRPLHSRLTIGVTRGGLPLEKMCVADIVIPANYNLGKMITCFLTGVSPDEKIAQICVNQDNWLAHTLKGIEGVSLDFSAEKPVVVVAANWGDNNLNPYPDQITEKEL
jgi:hypothetical protein